MGSDALPPRDPSKIVFEPSQQRRSFFIDPVASNPAGSSGEPKIIESTRSSSDGATATRPRSPRGPTRGPPAQGRRPRGHPIDPSPGWNRHLGRGTAPRATIWSPLLVRQPIQGPRRRALRRVLAPRSRGLSRAMPHRMRSTRSSGGRAARKSPPGLRETAPSENALKRSRAFNIFSIAFNF